MKRILLLLAAVTASAVLMTACGRNRNDADTNSTTHTEVSETQESGTEMAESSETHRRETAASDDSGIMDDAEDLVSDVVDDGREAVSDVVDEGRDIVTDLVGTDTTSTSESTR